MHGDAIKIRLEAPPVDDAANAALMELLAEALRVPRSAVRILSGTRARSKLVEVIGASAEQVAQLATRGSPR